MEYKRDAYYDDPKDSITFKRCIDVMSGLILKYDSDMLEKLERKEVQEAHCEEMDKVL